MTAKPFYHYFFFFLGGGGQLKIVQRCLNPGMQIVFVHDGMMERHIKSHPQHYLLLYVPGVTPENEGFLEAGANILTNHL